MSAESLPSALPPDFAALDANLLESLREGARWQGKARLVEADGVLLVRGSTPFPVGLSNAVARLDPGVSPGEVMERARAFFAEDGRAFTLWIRGEQDADLDTLARAERLHAISDIPTPWMTLRTRLPNAELPHGVTLSQVRDAAELRDVVQVSQQAWAPVGLPPAETASLLARPERMLAPHLIWVLARLEGRPAATAMVLCSHGVAGVYWVGTTPDARRRGLAELVTRAVGNLGLDAGMRVAALQASPMGRPVYARMGYESVSTTRWYLVRPARG